jgi:D-cysteine desulfhydrase
MHLARFPRRRYTPGFTPLEKLENLTRQLGGPELYIKRDDLLGLAGGGNKTRKLEFLVAEALAQGCDTLITVGAVQSNHCRLTLAAAEKEGLKCQLVLEERVPGSYDPAAGGNNFLYRLLGVEKLHVVPAGTDLAATMKAIADDLATKEGRKAYVIPGGGSNPLGALGYVACAEEILAQTFDMSLRVDHLVCASGSTGTHAGLLVGLVGNNSQIPVTGINVRRTRQEQEPNVHALAQETARLLGIGEIPRQAVTALGDWVGPGYSLPTPEMVEAVRLLARVEGILLDPVYTGKAMAGLLALVRHGRFKKGESVLFLHTGGAPALYHYQKVLLD